MSDVLGVTEITETFITWQENEKYESNQTPRFLTASTGDIRLPSILTGKE